ncbi:MAG: carboxypeptidase-like regulatory domain-containing protein [Polyangiaceae bacterium]
MLTSSRPHLRTALVALTLFGVAPALVWGCGDNKGSSFPPGGTQGAGADGSGAGSDQGGGPIITGSGGGSPCEGLECAQVKCSGGAKTTVTGVVYDPAGKTPLYNIAVYVPNVPLDPLVDGASCDKCASALSGDPVVTAITDTAGKFVLEDVPVGKDIPLVIQAGKWRRELVLPAVEKCVDNPLTDVEQTSLPSKQSEGHIPKIALTTGGADPLECLLRKIGIEDSEFTLGDGSGRVNLFHGVDGADRYSDSLNGGADFADAQTLWADQASLMKYDLVLLACEAGQYPDTKPATSLEAMQAYANAGGRLFASHWHNYWFEASAAPWPATADFDHQADLDDPFTALIDTSFPKGAALSQWLVNVNASTTQGEIEIREAQHTVNTANASLAQQWIYSSNPQSVQYFTFNAPPDAAEENQCGRVVYSDIHVSSGDEIGSPFPDGCQTADLSPQEKALLFMLFDLSSCIQPDDDPVEPPK